MKIQSNNHEDAPEWAMIELNGELVPPSDNPTTKNNENDDNLIESDRVELGSLRFTKEVSNAWRRLFCLFVSLVPPTLTKLCTRICMTGKANHDSWES